MIVVGAGADTVDYKLISICHKGDVVVSQDYGVAAMALGKGAYAIHQSGKWYTDENIDRMLMERHLNKKARRGSAKNHIKGPKKRTNEDDERFAQSFEKLVLMAQAKEGEQNGNFIRIMIRWKHLSGSDMKRFRRNRKIPQRRKRLLPEKRGSSLCRQRRRNRH